MKFLLLISYIYLILDFQQTSEVYYVVHIKGEIIHKSTSKKLKLQDQLHFSDELIFKHPEAKLVLYNTDKGHFIIDKTSTKDVEQSTAPISEFTKNIKLEKELFLSSRRYSGTRSTEQERINDLEQFFGINTFVFLGDSYKFRINTNTYPMTSGKYFVYRYSYGGNDYNKRIDYSADTLIFNKHSLYRVKGNLINPVDAGEVDIYYFNNKTSPVKITTLLPVFISENELKTELEVLLNVLKEESLSKEQILNKLFDHVELVYGNTNQSMFNNWAISKLIF
jgi:hypothetical protein